MDNPLFTIITVTYNSSKYVRDAIESVLASTFQDFEYIIGDDCSTDNTWEIIEEYKDPRIVKYRNETNLREYPNRNKAISMASGEWLLFIDGDDIIFPHGLDVFKYYASWYKDASMIIQKNYLNNVVWPIKFNPKEFLMNEFFGFYRFSSSSFASNLFRRDTLAALGNLSEDYKTGDEDIRLRFGATSETLFIPGWLTWPRETPGQASKNIRNTEMFFERSSQVLKLLELLQLNSELKEIIENGHKHILQEVRITCLKKLIRLHFKDALELLKFFGIKKIILGPKVNFKQCDILITPTPENPLR
jgi:glycosyltransferase involved in cell wall biosynthesis